MHTGNIRYFIVYPCLYIAGIILTQLDGGVFPFVALIILLLSFVACAFGIVYILANWWGWQMKESVVLILCLMLPFFDQATGVSSEFNDLMKGEVVLSAREKSVFSLHDISIRRKNQRLFSESGFSTFGIFGRRAGSAMVVDSMVIVDVGTDQCDTLILQNDGKHVLSRGLKKHYEIVHDKLFGNDEER